MREGGAFCFAKDRTAIYISRIKYCKGTYNFTILDRKDGLQDNTGYVCYSLYMSGCNPILPLEFYSSYRTHLLYHLADDGACFPGSQMTVIAIGQVDADFLGNLHLEAVHKLTPEGRER